MTLPLRIEDLTRALRAGGIDVLVGVPDSTLPGLGKAWEDDEAAVHIVAANEGGAVSIAAGVHLSGGDRAAAVYLQNTGLGIALDAYGSLVGPDVLDLPTLWIVGWRGHPDFDDVAHHRWHGELTEVMCRQAGLRPVRVPVDPPRLHRVVLDACQALRDGRSTALLVSPGTFSKAPRAPRSGFGQDEAIARLLDEAGPRDRFVAGVGYIGRALAQARAARGRPADDILAAGGMGHAASLALGLAQADRKRRVLCIDGDGAMLMHLGSALVVADRAPTSFCHVVLDNRCHASVGGTPTAFSTVDLSAVARSIGYRRVVSIADGPGLTAALRDDSPGPSLLHVSIEPDVDPVPPRPPPRSDQPATPRRSVVGPRLFTPGPGRLTPNIGRALDVETGSRSPAMVRCIDTVRRSVVEMIADPSYTCIPVGGSATTALDAILGSVLPTGCSIMVVVAGRYGERIAAMARRWGHDVWVLDSPRDRPLAPSQLASALEAGPAPDWLAFVHGETSTGVLHPAAALAEVAQRFGVRLLLDAVATIGVHELRLPALGVDVAFASAAKGLEGPAGLGLAVVRESVLQTDAAGPSLTLDLGAQWRRLESDGQFPFTPPTPALRGLEAALRQLAAEGGPAAREARYRRIGQALVDRLAPLGLHCVVEPAYRMPLVLVMDHQHGPVAPLVEQLRAAGIEVYPPADGGGNRLRIGLVGVTDDDVDALIRQISRAANS